MSKRYYVGEFAALGGVSVRTLHHYERLGLLHPTSRSEAGHRLYSDEDMLYLQQVLTLRYLGFSLRQIGELLRQPHFDLETSLRAQREVLGERVTQLQHMESVLDDLLRAKQRTGEWDWTLVASASSAASQALNKEDRMNDEQMLQRFAELGAQLAPGEREDTEAQWTSLIAEIQANLHLDPASAAARQLGERWTELRLKTEAAYAGRGFGDLWQAVGAKYRDNGLADNPNAPSPEVAGFIARVLEAGG